MLGGALRQNKKCVGVFTKTLEMSLNADNELKKGVFDNSTFA